MAGTAAFVTSLALSVWTAAAGANIFARPAFIDVSVVRSAPEAALLRFTVRASSLDRKQLVGVRVVEQTTGRLLYDATLPPDEKAVGEQKVELLVPIPPGPLLLAAWHRDVSHNGSPEPRCEQTSRPAGTVPVHATALADLPDGTACLTLLA